MQWGGRLLQCAVFVHATWEIDTDGGGDKDVTQMLNLVSSLWKLNFELKKKRILLLCADKHGTTKNIHFYFSFFLLKCFWVYEMCVKT